MFTKRNLQANYLGFVGQKQIRYIGARSAGYTPQPVNVSYGIGITSGQGKRIAVESIAPQNVAITTGLAVLSATSILNAGALLTTGPTTFNASALSQTITPDWERALSFTATASTGDGTYTSANAIIVTISGYDCNGYAVTEQIPLNSATAVVTKKTFYGIASIVVSTATASSLTVSVGWAKTFNIAYPIAYFADLVEVSRKATAATSYTIEALSGHTFDIGFASAPINITTVPPFGNATDVSLTINTANIIGSLAWTTVVNAGSNVQAPNAFYTNPAPNQSQFVKYNSQRLHIIATGGTYTLTFNGQTTSSLNYNASCSTIQTALQGLSTVGTGNMIVTQIDQVRYLITCAGTLVGAQPNITVTTSSLTGTQIWPSGSGRWIAELDYGDGTYEEMIITNVTGSTVTAYRSADGTVAHNHYDNGAQIVIRPQMTVTPTSLTANDRLMVTFRTGVL